ncbi:hypothetical protein [Rhizobium gallicum]|uniref:hypothetical protein n=1 Tax=Rhizobium gallicum TaxID=56730 RepID=UPI001EF767CE|nr:hypothetical protein [Rhizobium gallicum]ULJ73685.1 hypothetical protein L2W42_09015 [Rhizobium gallicum]
MALVIDGLAAGPTIKGFPEFHPKAFEDFLAGVTLRTEVYHPRYNALMIWRNLQLIGCIGDDRLE